ncbi:MAG: hypothetical protein FWD88_05230, partial [Treponema sp.]|nr:hypothetical protein [Treponema sp.]
MSELKPRPATRRELVIDDFHGTKVADPYRWLENDTDPDALRWMEEQNGDFERYISSFGIRDELRSRIKDLFNYATCG